MYYARLKPHNHKQGYILYRYHFQGHLFNGGERPTWYRVDDGLAQVLQNDVQETGRQSFDVVSAEEKVAIDKIEEERRMVQMGMMSATLPLLSRPNPVDLLSIRPVSRESAIPEARRSETNTAPGGDLVSRDFKNPLTE